MKFHISPSANGVLAALLAINMTCGPALAHASIEARDAKAGAPVKAVIKVPHGCEGSPTVAVTVEIPEGVIGVKPQPKPGWTLSVERTAYEKSYPYYHGKTLTEGVRQITWSGGPLLDEHFDEFVFQGFIAEAPAAGVYYLPVRQRCEKGEANWTEVPAAGQDSKSLKAPAPTIRIAGSPAPATDGGSNAIRAGNLVIQKPWVRATPGGATVGAGYLQITNTGTEPDRLTGGSTPAAERVEVHEMREAEGGVMQMRQLERGLEIPPNASIELKPGGTHLMLMGLAKPIQPTEPPTLSLQFEKAGSVDVPFAVESIGSTPPATGHHHH